MPAFPRIALNKNHLVIFGLIGLLLFEILFSSLILDPHQAISNAGEIASKILHTLGTSVKLIIVAAVVLVVSTANKLKHYSALIFYKPHPYRWLWLLAHLALYGYFLQLSYQLEAINYKQGISLWLVVGLGSAVVWAFSLAEPSAWIRFVRNEWKRILASIFIAILIVIISEITRYQWGILGHATFTVSAEILSWMSDGIQVYPQHKELGTNDFVVNIGPECAGYEGIGLITAFTAIYLYLYRREIIFSRAWILFPIGILTIWLLNAFRIALLIKIGDVWSPEIAVGGFHSQAGWIFFIASSLAILQLSRLSFFNKSDITEEIQNHDNQSSLAYASLLPLVALLGTTLLTQAFSADFNWLYPIKAVVTGFVIWYVWKKLQLTSYRINLEAILGGVLVAVAWAFLVPENPQYNQQFETTLSSVSPALMGAWIFFRFLGSTIVVPIAEELGFRAYLYAKLARVNVVTQGTIPLNFTAIAISSLAFGLLHGDWFAGSIAGLVYAVIRLRSDSIWDAIVAHSITNTLLFIYVMQSREWHLL